MKHIQTALMASLLTITLSSVAMAGNIGMRTDAATAPQATTAGNIGMKSESSDASILGNIGSVLQVVISVATIW